MQAGGRRARVEMIECFEIGYLDVCGYFLLDRSGGWVSYSSMSSFGVASVRCHSSHSIGIGRILIQTGQFVSGEVGRRKRLSIRAPPPLTQCRGRACSFRSFRCILAGSSHPRFHMGGVEEVDHGEHDKARNPSSDPST